MADKYGIKYVIVNIDNEALKASPIPSGGALLPVFSVPNIPNCSVEVVSVSLTAGILATDGTNDLLLNLSFHDKSAASNTTLLTGANGAAGDLKAAGGFTVFEGLTIWKGSQVLDAGDSIHGILTITTPDVAGDGYHFTVGYRVLEWNGQ